MAWLKTITADTAGGGNKMRKQMEILIKHESGIAYAVQEWGIKNNLRLFGYFAGIMDFHGGGGPAEKTALRAKGFFIDPAFKFMELHIFDIKEKANNVTVTKTKHSKGFLKGYRYPIKFAKTRNFDNKIIIPVTPLYDVLIGNNIILPFQSVLKNKEWAALPFEDGGSIKQTEI
jgi:hypothetical protein